MPIRTCWACNKRFETTPKDATLHRHVDHTYTVTFPHYDCGCTNEHPIVGVDLHYLIAVGAPIVEPDPVSIVFNGQLDDQALTDAYLDQWSRR